MSDLIPAHPAPLAAPDPDARFAAAIGDLWGRLESPESRRGYQDDWRRYCAWLATQGIHPRAADVATVQGYVNHLRDTGKAKSTRARALSVLREVYRALVTGGLCAMNPAREVKNPRVDTTPRTPWLDEEKVRALFATTGEEWVDRRDRLALLCLVLLGWRRAEVARIAVEDFTGAAVWHTVKRGKRDLTGVPPYLLAEIEAWRAFAGITEGYLLPRAPDDRSPVSGKIVYDIVQRAAKAAGIGKATPHAIRRTFITILEQRGVPLRDLQLAVSHESVTTTERYQKASRAARQAPGEMLVDLVRRP